VLPDRTLIAIVDHYVNLVIGIVDNLNLAVRFAALPVSIVAVPRAGAGYLTGGGKEQNL
jgi:hypothetical protein